MRFLTLSSLLALLTACPAKVATVEVTPASVSIKSEAETKQMTATAKSDKGEAIEGDKVVTWTASDPAVAAIDANGKLKPVGSGTATITAKIDEASGTAKVEVLLLKGMKLESPAIVVRAAAVSSPLKVAFTNEKGELLEMKGQKIEWKTADPNIATVGPDGVIMGVAPGSTTVSARVEALSADVAVTVNPADVAADAGPEGVAPPAPPAP
jgi:uncharacterized protein YjdB